jgi:hypothetical protein
MQALYQEAVLAGKMPPMQIFGQLTRGGSNSEVYLISPNVVRRLPDLGDRQIHRVEQLHARHPVEAENSFGLKDDIITVLL